jgi:DNA-binding GntR family transcriptional regulator
MHRNIYETLRDRILFMEYRPGRILNENVLAKEFGVSRTPLREVLYRLEWEDLVRVLPRTGTMVTEIEFSKIMHVFQVRIEMEDLIGRLAAEQFTPDRIGKLENLQRECRSLLDRKDHKALAAIDFKTKALFYEAAGNPILAEIADRLYALTFRLWCIIMEKGDWNEEVHSVATELTELQKTLTSRNPTSVGTVRRDQLIKHLGRLRNKFLGLS